MRPILSTTGGSAKVLDGSMSGTKQAPTASFTTNVSGLNLTVDGSASSDADGTISSYAWKFGDGGTATGATPATHTYAAGGTYTVTLTVTDNDNATNDDDPSGHGRHGRQGARNRRLQPQRQHRLGVG